MAFAFTATVMADPVSDLKGFSVFKDVDLAKLAAGEIMSVHGPAMSFPRGASAQSCYVVMAPLQKTLDFHQHWNASKHSELKVWLQAELPSRPTIESFGKISSAPDNSAVQWLVGATEKLGPGQSPLQLSREEAKLFAAAGSPGKGMPGEVSAFWSNVLLRRANAFAAGGLSQQPPYELSGGTVRAGDEVRQLLKDQPGIAGQFSGMIAKLDGAPSNPQLYWELSDVDGKASLSLGAFLGKQVDGGMQAIDLQYYSSDGFYVLVTLYNMWPVKIGDRDATLVWRGDLVSAPSIAELRGVEKIASGSAMAKEIQKTIGFFLKDVATSR